MSHLTNNSSCPNNSRVRGASVSERNQRTLRKWTPEEESILINAVRNSPHNLSAAFLSVSPQINRSFGAIEQHWYTKTRLKSPVFICASNKKASYNQKNSFKTQTPKKSSNRLWKAILSFFKG